MVEEQAPGPHHRRGDAEVLRQVPKTDVLEHADAGDLVEVRRAEALLEFAIIELQDLDAIRQSGVRDTFACQFELAVRQRDADRVHAVVLGGVQGQPAPAAADVEEAFAGAQTQLAADQVELGELRVLQRVAGVAEVGARVHHERVEPEPGRSRCRRRSDAGSRRGRAVRNGALVGWQCVPPRSRPRHPTGFRRGESPPPCRRRCRCRLRRTRCRACPGSDWRARPAPGRRVPSARRGATGRTRCASRPAAPRPAPRRRAGGPSRPCAPAQASCPWRPACALRAQTTRSRPCLLPKSRCPILAQRR